MRRPAEITSQDWYRVRRGEDELAWGRCADVPEVDGLCFSRRASQEFAFLDTSEKAAVLTQLRKVCADPYGQHSAAILRGAGRWLTAVGQMRIIYQVDAERGRVLVSTIRGGKVLDPEAVGPVPTHG